MRSEIGVLAAVLAASGLSMLAFAFTSRGRTIDDKTGRGGSFFLGFWVRNWFYWVMGPVTSGAVKMRLNPFVFNAVAVAFGAASMVFFAAGRLPLAGAMVLLSGLADVMDGEVARGRGLASKSGAFLDSTLDRFSELAAFVGIAVFFGSGWRSIAVLVALGGSLLVSYTRARGESVGVLCKEGLMQRAERLVLTCLVCLTDGFLTRRAGWAPGTAVFWVVALIAIGTFVTAAHRTLWIANRLRERRTAR
jgi:phosphatidylglycerophosphate synthase